MSPGFVARIGLAIVRPRAALALAGDRRDAGRSGSDLLVAIAILLAATQLRWIVSALWLGAVVDAGVGLRAFVHVLTRTLMLDLAALVIGALAIFVGGGPRRELGRAFDLACVTVLPMVLVHLTAQLVASLVGSTGAWLPVEWAVVSIGCGWMAGLVVLACFAARRPAAPPDAATAVLGRRAGWAAGAIAAAGFVFQVAWIVRYADEVRPLTPGAPAPALSLPKIGAQGALGERVALRTGRVTVIDFWATWCGPCLKAMPALEAFARRHPEVDVVAVNLDDPAEARAMFDEAHMTMTLVADDGETSERFGVTAIPHTVVIDRTGTLRKVAHGGGLDLEAELRALAR